LAVQRKRSSKLVPFLSLSYPERGADISEPTTWNGLTNGIQKAEVMTGGTLGLPLLVSFRVVENLGLLIASFLLLLLGAEIFTNGVEWLGHRLGVSESATGSILAAVGTALPETMIPVIAIIHGFLTGDTAAADHVGVGAILGAPFMLATIALFLVGASVLYFSERRLHGRAFHFNATATRRDLRFFLIGFSLALLARVS
jgi:cation:H+ antiporter